MKHPLDQFLKNKLANHSSRDEISFDDFQKTWNEQKDPAQLDQWLNQNAETKSSEEFNFSDFLAHQEKQELNKNPLDQWIKSQVDPSKVRLNYPEFINYWRIQIFLKWAKRAALVLLLFLSGMFLQKLFLSKPNQSSSPTVAQLNFNQNILKEDFNGAMTNDEEINNTSSSNSNTKSQPQKFTIHSYQHSDIPVFEHSTLQNANASKKNLSLLKGKKRTSLPSFNNEKSASKSGLIVNNEVVFINNPKESETKNYSLENIFLSPLNSKMRSICTSFNRSKDDFQTKSEFKKRSFLQTNIWLGPVQHKLDFVGERNKNWEPLNRWNIAPQINLNVAYFKPLMNGFGWGFGGNYSHTYFNKDIEFHITEIPVVDSASGKILGYIPLGPRGQIHVEDEIQVNQTCYSFHGSIYNSWKISPTFEIGLQQNLGFGIQKNDFLQVIDPISLQLASMPNQFNWIGTGKSIIWVQTRVANHWGLGGQIGLPLKVNFSSKNNLIFREMSIFEAGVSVRYYLNSK